MTARRKGFCCVDACLLIDVYALLLCLRCDDILRRRVQFEQMYGARLAIVVIMEIFYWRNPALPTVGLNNDVSLALLLEIR